MARLLACLCSYVCAVSALNASIIDGVLSAPGSSPRFIGTLSSNVSAAISSVFAGVAGNASVILKNSTSYYNYLTLSGAYDADASILLLPSLVLVLSNATITARSATVPTGALISATSAAGSAVVGRGVARLVCAPDGGAKAPQPVYAGQSQEFILDGVEISDCGSVHLEGLPFVAGGEVANCVISNSRGQAVWMEKISRAVIHGNTIRNASYHSIDFDAFSSNSLAYNNTVTDSREEAVFIEQGATYITVLDNTLGPRNSHGVSVFNNAIGSATSGHVIARNRVFGCTTAGISVGSTAPRSGAPDLDVLIAGNTLWDNGGQGIHTNGGQHGTVYVANDDSTDGVSLYTLTAGSSANISFSDPSDRVRVGKV